MTNILLFLSLSLNLFLVWFIYRSMYRLSDLVALLEDVSFKISFFEKHLETVYELEMFYGDSTLESLLQHSRELTESFQDFRKEYAILAEEEINDKLQEKTEE